MDLIRTDGGNEDEEINPFKDLTFSLIDFTVQPNCSGAIISTQPTTILIEFVFYKSIVKCERRWITVIMVIIGLIIYLYLHHLWVVVQCVQFIVRCLFCS